MPAAYEHISIAGGDTSKPLAMAKRLQVIERHLPLPGKLFLDCGCGAGQYVLALRNRLKLEAHGIEFDEQKVKELIRMTCSKLR
jgi:ubiquinone/menaquinone biosynthesis C-methylase UbiE